MSSSIVQVTNPSTWSHSMPLDIIIVILSMLPVKTLVRFTSVCKTWYTLIKSSNFISDHLKHSKLNPNSRNDLLVTEKDLRWDSLFLYEDYFDRVVTLDLIFRSVVGVCNGLVCAVLDYLHECQVILFNPATRQSYQIPSGRARDFVKNTTVNESMGFGFHPSTNDYKLIRIVHVNRYKLHNYKTINHAEVYSWSSDTWRDIEVPFQYLLSNVVAAPGIFYCVASTSNFQYPKRKLSIVSFNMSDEVFRVIEGPLSNWYNTYHELLVLKGELALVDSSGERSFTLWVLNEGQSCWSKNFKIGPIPRIWLPEELVVDESLLVVGCSGDGHIAVENYSDGVVELFLYDPANREIKRLPFDSFSYHYQVYGFIGSLVSVKKDCRKGNSRYLYV